MAGVAYRYYRLYVMKSQDNSTYKSVEEFSLYETLDGSSTNLCLGATATASSIQSSAFAASKAIDGRSNTCWESSTSDTPEWLQVKLPVEKLVRRFSFNVVTFVPEGPEDFKVQGSHDGLVWVDLYEEIGNKLPLVSKPLSITVGGFSKIDTGNPSSKVLVFDWVTGDKIRAVTPRADGSWTCQLVNLNEVLVTHVGPSGYKPQSDGPITPYSW